jgi:hypothetical protein
MSMTGARRSSYPSTTSLGLLMARMPDAMSRSQACSGPKGDNLGARGPGSRKGQTSKPSEATLILLHLSYHHAQARHAREAASAFSCSVTFSAVE